MEPGADAATDSGVWKPVAGSFASVREVPLNGGPSEDELVEAARRDPEAFSAIYRIHYQAIGRYLYRRTGDRHVAEEALQLIAVDYETLPFVLDHEDALRSDAPKSWPEGNLALNNRNGALEQYRILQRIDAARATKLFNHIK